MDTTASDLRRERGLQIASTKRIKVVGPVWVVPSQTHGGSYVVSHGKHGGVTCTCPDYELRRAPCKHVFAVEYARHQVTHPDGTKVVTETLRVTYSQNWSAYNAGQVNEKELVQSLLKGLCAGIVAPEQPGRGRPRLPLADVVYSAVMKVYGGMSGRRSSTSIREAEARGDIDRAPHYNSISAYLEKPELMPVLKALVEESALPLKAVETAFAIDSTGFSSTSYERWFDHKWGKQRRYAHWVKCHAMVGVKTNIVTSVEMTPEYAHDATQAVALIDTTSRNFALTEVTGDAAYLAKPILDAVERVGAVPYIPFKMNSKPGKHEAWQRLWHLFHARKREFLTHYHARSNVETTFSMIKRKFGGSVRSKKVESQMNEVLCKIVAHNLCVLAASIYELGIEPTFWAEDRGCPGNQ